jgi:hypothetical protein
MLLMWLAGFNSPCTAAVAVFDGVRWLWGLLEGAAATLRPRVAHSNPKEYFVFCTIADAFDVSATGDTTHSIFTNNTGRACTARENNV